MNSGLQERLYDMEVTPPAAVWEKLSVTLDEINDDNLLAEKVLDTELIPPATAWKNISRAIGTEEKKELPKRGLVVNFKRLAAAAIFIGIVFTAWFVFRKGNGNDTLAGVQTGTEKRTDTNATAKKNDTKDLIDSPTGLSASQPRIASQSTNKDNTEIRKKSLQKTSDRHVNQATVPQYTALNKETPRNNSFGQPIDDLSLVTSDQNYLTMVNANGRLAKIPAQFANLVPHLQNKPVSEDYYEVMFGEGAYWKETLNEWRKKVASVPVSSGDAFTSFIELLKTVQDK